MKIIQTTNPDFTILEDVYPYTESKKIINGLEEWFKHPSRAKDDSISNYSLDMNSRNTLGHSFEYRLRDGYFHFLKYKDEVIAFAGMYVDESNKVRGCHRLFIKPEIDVSLNGAFTIFVIPYQIEMAKSIGASEYTFTVNEKNLKIFNFIKSYKKTGGSYEAYNKIGRLFSLSEEPVIINTVPQWVASIKL